MWVQVVTRFLAGRDVYEAGELRMVDAERGQLLITSGCAREVEAPSFDPPTPQEPSSVTLDVQDGLIGVQSPQL